MTRTGGTALEALRALESLGAAPGAVDVWVANVDPADDALFRFFGKAPPCFRKLVTNDGTQAAHQLARHPLLEGRIEVVRMSHATECAGFSLTDHRVSASLNPAKARTADWAVCVPSGVPAQPDEALAVRGARNRVDAAKKIVRGRIPATSVYGFESGVDAEWRGRDCVRHQLPAVDASHRDRRADAPRRGRPARVPPRRGRGRDDVRPADARRVESAHQRRVDRRSHRRARLPRKAVPCHGARALVRHKKRRAINMP